MTQVEKLRDHSRRFQLNLTLDQNLTPTELNEFNHLDKICKLSKINFIQR